MKKIIFLILITINSVCFAQDYQWQFSNIPVIQNEYIRSLSFINPNTGWIGTEIANTNARVFKTTNKGSSFVEVFKYTDYSTSNMSYDIGVDFINESVGFVSTGDKIFKTTNGGSTFINPISTEIPAKYSLSQNYPNPFNPMCNVQFSMYKAGNVRLVVYDVQGREVQTLVNEKLSAGTYEVKFDGSKLNSGVYFYKMMTGNFTETKKMLLVK